MVVPPGTGTRPGSGSRPSNHLDQATPAHLPGGKPGKAPWGAATPTPTEGSSFVSTEQQEALDAILRQAALPIGSDVNEQRRLLRELTSAQPLPPGVTVTAAELGGVPTAEVTVDGVEPRHVILYFHGGVYAIG